MSAMQISDQAKINTYYQALLERDSNYVGIFFVGVKTTSIFCISTCHARKPKFENVEFYRCTEHVLAAGYRPCKVCKPLGNADEMPESVRRALQIFSDNPQEKLSDSQLSQAQISPVIVRRWFKKHFGMTFHAYQRTQRMNNAMQAIKAGNKTIDTAFNTGYDSLSGFTYSYKKIVGECPSHSAQSTIILISRLTTPLGPMVVCATDHGVCLLEFSDNRRLDTEFEKIQTSLKAKMIAGENTHIRQAKQELDEYFQGTRREFTLQLQTPGTAFQNVVWRSLMQVPFGHTCSYYDQAVSIGKPTAIRAVATANSHNRIAIVLPCHRIIGKDGKLTGYNGGVERKHWLLEHEQTILNK